MNVVICGAGEVGRHAAEVLGTKGCNVTIVDKAADKLATLEDVMDVRTLRGNATEAQVLKEAGADKADLCVSATDNDEINILSASIATGLGTDRSIARVHHSVYFEGVGLDYAVHFGIDHLVCPDYATAQDIARVMRNPGALAVDRFAKGRIEMQQVPISDDAPAIGKTLGDLAIRESARLVTVERDGASFIPDGTTMIRRGDIVTLIGDVKTFDDVRSHFRTKESSRKRVMVMGGTPLAVWLCRELHSRNFAIRLFEPHRERAEELAAKLDWVTVLRVDPLDTDTLTLERIDQADWFVALTDDDENNILAAARAKSMGAREVIAVLQRGTYLHLLEHVGIDRAFSPRVAAAAEIQRLVSTDSMRCLASLAVGFVDVYEIRVSLAAQHVIGVPLQELRLPEQTIIAAVQRGDEAYVPGGQDKIAAGETVVVVAPAGSEKQLKKFFAAA